MHKIQDSNLIHIVIDLYVFLFLIKDLYVTVDVHIAQIISQYSSSLSLSNIHYILTVTCNNIALQIVKTLS